MSCKGHHGFEDDNCVCSVLRAIVDAQDQVSPDVENNCDVSCERSIQQLLGEVSPATNGPNTIPVILYCECAPFQGFGVSNTGTSTNPNFECVQSFIFRVNSVDDNCCASLELLTTTTNGGGGTYPPTPIVENPCDQFPASGFEGTGICITVDLNCFCGVSCLEPIRL